MKKPVVCLVLVTSCLAGAYAQNAGSSANPVTIPEGDYKLSVILTDLRSFGVNFVISSELAKTDPSIHVNLTLQPVRDAMDAIAAALDDHWVVFGSTYVLKPGSAPRSVDGGQASEHLGLAPSPFKSTGTILDVGNRGFGGDFESLVSRDGRHTYSPAWSGNGPVGPLVDCADGWRSIGGNNLILPPEAPRKTATWYVPMSGSSIRYQELLTLLGPKSPTAEFLDTVTDTQWKQSWNHGYVKRSDLTLQQRDAFTAAAGDQTGKSIMLIEHGRRLVVRL